jgi:hypothetical protein
MNIQTSYFLVITSDVLTSANWFRARPARFHDRDLLTGDEAAFKMDGKVNTWNVRSYAPKNQTPANFNFKRNCNPGKVTVWAGLFGGCQIVGPYFFEGNVNGNSYLAMLTEFVVPNIRDQLGVGNNGRFTRGKDSD